MLASFSFRNFLSNILTSNQNHERPQWDSTLEYYLCAIGYAVGFGSLWRFPYLVYENGGGAFLVPYFFFVIILCFPLFLLETSIGQSFRISVTGSYERIAKRFRGIGIAQMVVIFFTGSFYNILLAYSLIFLWDSFSWKLPWKVEDVELTGTLWNSNYFKDNVLHLTSGVSELGNINTPVLIATIISFCICYLCIAKGLKATGKVVYVTAPAPYFFLTIFLIRGLFLDGAWDGIKFLFAVDLSKLWNLTTWYRAANQVLFQYSLATGAINAFASYKEPHEKLIKPAFVIPGITAITGILCGFTVFTYMGHMAKLANVSLSNLPLAGPDLVFVAYPAALTLMPWPNLWAILFFIMLFTLGIDTEFAFMETIAGYIEDEKIKIFEKEMRVEVSRVLIMVSLFLAGFILNFDGGFHFLSVYDNYATVVPMMLIATLECVVFGWIYGIDKIDEIIYKNVGEKFPSFATICIEYISFPLLALMTFFSFFQLIFVDLFTYPWWGSLIGLVLMGLPVGIIIFNYINHKDDKPKETWIELFDPIHSIPSN